MTTRQTRNPDGAATYPTNRQVGIAVRRPTNGIVPLHAKLGAIATHRTIDRARTLLANRTFIHSSRDAAIVHNFKLADVARSSVPKE